MRWPDRTVSLTIDTHAPSELSTFGSTDLPHTPDPRLINTQVVEPLAYSAGQDDLDGLLGELREADELNHHG